MEVSNMAREELRRKIIWLIENSSYNLAQLCYNHGRFKELYKEVYLPCIELNGCPFANNCKQVSGEVWRQYLIEHFNKLISEV